MTGRLQPPHSPHSLTKFEPTSTYCCSSLNGHWHPAIKRESIPTSHQKIWRACNQKALWIWSFFSICDTFGTVFVWDELHHWIEQKCSSLWNYNNERCQHYFAAKVHFKKLSLICLILSSNFLLLGSVTFRFTVILYTVYGWNAF